MNTTENKLRAALKLARGMIVVNGLSIPRTIEKIDEALAIPSQECKTCGGTGVVDDGEIDCYPNGEPYLSGPVKCVKDCPVCALPATTEPAPITAPSMDAPSDAEIRAVFLANGFTVKEGQADLKPYVFAAARALLALKPARCPTCNGNDLDAPCAYPGEGMRGCPRDARLAAAAPHLVERKAQPVSKADDGAVYAPLTLDEVRDLTAMQAGAPWDENVVAGVADLFAIADELRTKGERPVDPADVQGHSHRWNDEGERCLKCGDKDWIADRFCSVSDAPMPERAPGAPMPRDVAPYPAGLPPEPTLSAAQPVSDNGAVAAGYVVDFEPGDELSSTFYPLRAGDPIPQGCTAMFVSASQAHGKGEAVASDADCVLRLLEAAGHITPGKLAEAREIASRLTDRAQRPAAPAAEPALVAVPADLIERLAQGWDGCMYDAPGETVDIGADIRNTAKRMAATPAASTDPVLAVEPFQQRVQPWMMACFGEMISGDREERNHRFLEEALELVQSTGCTASEAHQLVEYVYGRPVGEPAQEVGGVMVTLAALCLANGLDMHDAAEVELARIWTKVDVIRAKQAAKPKHSPLPEASAPSPHASVGAVPTNDDRLRAEIEIKAQEIYDGWKSLTGWVPWVQGGNSDRQSDARRLAWKAKEAALQAGAKEGASDE